MSRFLSKLLAEQGLKPGRQSKAWKVASRGGIGASMDFRRILALPRRALDLSEERRLTTQALLRRPGGTEELWPIQAAALHEIGLVGGGLLPIGVGCGKSRIAFLAPSVITCERPLVLYPASLRKQTVMSVLPACEKHWRLHGNLNHASIETLQTDRGLALLDELRPDLVVVDEAHLLKNPKAARTKRLFDYLKASGARSVFMSGTLCRRSIHEFWHMAVQSLGDQAPVPLHWPEARDWADALDENPLVPVNPGVLREFCVGMELPRQGFKRRLVSTLGVVAHEGMGECPASIKISAVPLESSGAIKGALAAIDERWVKGSAGSEVELDDPLSVWRAKREACMGFFYRWDWSGQEPDHEWLAARKGWARAVREICQRGFADTAMTAARWVEALSTNYARNFVDALYSWRRMKERVGPVTVAEWFSLEVVGSVLWLMEETPGLLVWASDVAVMDKLAEMGANVVRAGTTPQDDGKSKVLSLQAHKLGLNLQGNHYQNLVLSPPSASVDWDQLIARTHRPGQKEDSVEVKVLLHTEFFRQEFVRAVDNAVFLRQATPVAPKLLLADFDLPKPIMVEITNSVAKVDISSMVNK